MCVCVCVYFERYKILRMLQCLCKCELCKKPAMQPFKRKLCQSEEVLRGRGGHTRIQESEGGRCTCSVMDRERSVRRGQGVCYQEAERVCVRSRIIIFLFQRLPFHMLKIIRAFKCPAAQQLEKGHSIRDHFCQGHDSPLSPDPER